MKSVRYIVKQLVPYGLMRLWLMNRYSVKIDEPLFHYPGWRQRLVRLVKFSMPYGISMVMRKPYGGNVWNGNIKPVEWLRDYSCISNSRRKQEAAFKTAHKLSILVPVYNTPPRLLREMIRSVCDQTCGAWELCLGDASDAAHGETSQVASTAARGEPRIKYCRLKRNDGISANTNAILPNATGDILALLDHDDLLHPSAVCKTLMAFEDDQVDFSYTDELAFLDDSHQLIKAKHYKPDYSPDYLRSVNYICHFSAFRRALLAGTNGFFNSEYDGSQDHDLFLRLTAISRRIRHIPEILYFWRACAGSTADDVGSKGYAAHAGCLAVAADLKRRGWKGVVEQHPAFPTFYRIRYETDPSEKVSIIIPTKNHLTDLQKCLTSIFTRSTHRNYEIVILDNGSTEPELKAYYRELQSDARVRIIYHDAPFNYSEINNYAVRHGAVGKYLLFLNNDTEVIAPTWIEELQMYAQRPDVGCVGAKLLYADDTIQHAGVILGIGGVAGHAFHGAITTDLGPAGRLISVMNYSIVTAACMMIRREVFDRVGGFYEGLAVAFNDVDFCMKVREAGYLNVWTPHAALYHYESKSRGYDDTPEKKRRSDQEIAVLRTRWLKQIEAGDPYYNPNYSLCAPFVVER